MKNKSRFLLVMVLGCLLFSGCKDDDDIPKQTNTIIYKLDGRTVKMADPLPIALDVSEDGQVDFTIFVQLTGTSQGDRLYAGMNPIGDNLIKSGPPIDDNFLSMGLLIAESPNATIDFDLEANQEWTTDHSALAIRNTFANGDITYEGHWADSEQMVAIQNIINGSVYFGWLRLKFDKATEIVTLIDFAYNARENQPIMAGAESN